MAGTLKVKLQEEIVLNNQVIESSNTRTIASIGEISKRILTITTNEAEIATFSGAVASSGHYNDSAVRYIRFTNKDDTYFITLTFRNQDNDEVAITHSVVVIVKILFDISLIPVNVIAFVPPNS